jgi:polysaccharide deacetylase family protein (PEP-CTERM system associated)
MVNIFSIDLEDYFHPTEVGCRVADWAHVTPRIEFGTNFLLDLLEQHNTRGTFFVLGWVADRHPQLVKTIAKAGHEIGCHSYHHRLVFNLTPDEFKEDTLRAMRVIEDVLGISPKLYRAPSYSIVSKSLWALDILAELGFTHDSSIYPVVHDRYGVSSFRRDAHPIRTPSGSIMAKQVIPVGGGAYLRLFPYRYTAAGIRRLNTVEQQPACIYTHPWELDSDHPRMAKGLISSLRTYLGLRSMGRKVRRLFEEFQFSTMGDVHPYPLGSRMSPTATETEPIVAQNNSNLRHHCR